MRYILRLLKSILRQDKREIDRLYYLDGITQIKPNKYILDECMITK